MVSDFRLPGGTSHSNAEEIQAQHQMGLSTELLQVNSHLSARAKGINPRIEHLIRSGQAALTLVPGPRPRPLVIVRHPSTVEAAVNQFPAVPAEQVIIVVNATPIDWTGKQHWRAEKVHRHATSLFGVEPWWAPIGPKARAAIVDHVPPDRLRDSDWSNIIDIDSWWVDRSNRSRDRRPIVGRHSRPSTQKWPTATDRELIYPSDGRWDIRVLGWDPIVQEALGEPPEAWTVHAFGTIHPALFLAGLDFFVYFHHPNLTEAFGRTILEAIASGLPAVLPRHFEPLFGAAAVYADPETVQDVVEALWADPAAYQAHVDLARTLVHHRFSYHAHGSRLATMLPEGRLQPITPADDADPTDAAEAALTVSSDDHRSSAHIWVDLTTEESGSSPGRQADVLDPPVVTVALTTTTAARHTGPRTAWRDVVPDPAETGLPRQDWAAMVAGRLRLLLEAHPGATVTVVTDHRLESALASVLADRPSAVIGPADARTAGTAEVGR